MALLFVINPLLFDLIVAQEHDTTPPDPSSYVFDGEVDTRPVYGPPALLINILTGIFGRTPYFNSRNSPYPHIVNTDGSVSYYPNYSSNQQYSHDKAYSYNTYYRQPNYNYGYSNYYG